MKRRRKDVEIPKNQWKAFLLLYWRRGLLLLLFPFSLLLLAISKRSVWFTEEIFAKRIYKVMQVIGSVLTGWIPFSLAEILVVSLPILLILFVVFFTIRMVNGKGKRILLCLKTVLNAFCIASIGFFIYTVGCGMNYNRVSVADYCNLTVRESSKQELYDLCMELSNEASKLRKELSANEDEYGALALPISKWDLAREVRDAYQELSKEIPVLSGYVAPSKGIFFSRQFSAFLLTGIFTCFTMEANVNIDVPDYSIAATMAHELSHVKGFMKEEEANFLAFLVCRVSESPYIRYSGLMDGLIYCGNALAAQDYDLYTEVWYSYDEGVQLDFRRNSVYWEQFENTPVSKAADKVNDTYLKANNQEDGVKSYGRVVDLLLADYRQRHGIKE